MKKSLFLFLSILSFNLAFGQVKVTGIILESNTNEPVIGASVVEKGSVISK